MDNGQIADLFGRVAQLLSALKTSPFRVRAYGREQAVPKASTPPASAPPPGVAELLAIDARYRELASKNDPEGTAWPVLHTEQGGYHVTALFSNTAAHALGTTGDWVVISYEDIRGEGQCTVVTERRGALSGLRVVRGREAECFEEHARSFAQARRRLRASRRQTTEEEQPGIGVQAAVPRT